MTEITELFEPRLLTAIVVQIILSLPGMCASKMLATKDVNETRQSRVSIFFLDPGKGISASHRPGTALGPASDHPFAPRQQSNSDHAGKSTYSGEIESLDRDRGIASLVLGMRFPGN